MLLATSETMELADGFRRGGEHGGGGFFLFPLLLLLLGGLAWWWFGRRNGRIAPSGRGAAMGVLDDRFARGEITREEFEYRRAVLNRDKQVPPAPRSTAAPTPPATGSAPTAGPNPAGTPPTGTPPANRPTSDPTTGQPGPSDRPDDPDAG